MRPPRDPQCASPDGRARGRGARVRGRRRVDPGGRRRRGQRREGRVDRGGQMQLLGRVRRHGARGQGALPQADQVHVTREGEVAAADVAADRRRRAGGRPVDPGGSVRRVADRAAVDVEPQTAAVERAGDVVPAAVPDVGRARGRRDDVAGAVEGVEGDATVLGGIEAVGAGEAALAAAGDDVVVRAGAGGRAHHGLGGERRRRELGRVGELDVGAAAEAQRAARDAGDPLRIRGVDAGGGAEAPVEPERAAVERGLADGLVEAPFADRAGARVRGLGAEREGERDRTGSACDPPSPLSPARHETRSAPAAVLHLGSLPYTCRGGKPPPDQRRAYAPTCTVNDLPALSGA